MAMFLGHTAFMLELAMFVAGLALWNYGRQGAAALLRAGGLVAIVGAALAALCTAYYMVRYQVQGDFERAYPSFHHGMKRHGMMEGEMMKGGGMGAGMMGGMKSGMKKEGMSPGAGAPEEKPEAHEEHHPEQATE
jgi:hypothetical protein